MVILLISASVVPTKAEEKKCSGSCQNVLPVKEFYDDQTGWKGCFNAERKLWRRAKAQGLEQWLTKEQETNPKGFKALQKDSKRHCINGEPPSKFCMVSWKKNGVKVRDS